MTMSQQTITVHTSHSGFVIKDGKMVESQSLWRLSIIPELFWALVNFIVLFFQTMISPNKTSKGSQYTSDYRPGGPPQPPQRRMGGFRGGRGGPAAPPMAGG